MFGCIGCATALASLRLSTESSRRSGDEEGVRTRLGMAADRSRSRQRHLRRSLRAQRFLK
jgi:hypothetical protein